LNYSFIVWRLLFLLVVFSLFLSVCFNPETCFLNNLKVFKYLFRLIITFSLITFIFHNMIPKIEYICICKILKFSIWVLLSKFTQDKFWFKRKSYYWSRCNYRTTVLGRAAVPSGASTGEHEAVELRDGGKAYLGKEFWMRWRM
jgi:hypothetical protein